MSKPTLALIPSGYKSEKVYSILPNNGSGDFTFDRDTVATRVRKDGLIEEVAADIPRLDWFNSNCPNLLLEPSRTNLAHYSEQIDNAYWNKTGLSVTANQITSPDGTLTADKLQRTSTSSSFVSKAFTKTASEVQNFSLSVFVKKGDSRYATLSLQGDYPDRAYLQYDFEQGTINASIDFEDFTILSTKAENYNDGWVRLSLVLSTDAHSSVTVLISPKNDAVTTALSDSSDSCFMYVWGIQLEKDTYSTSYIKTEGGSATRNADVCTDAGDVNVFNDNEGVLYAEISAFANDGTYRFISVSSGAYANSVRIGYFTTTNVVEFRVVSGGVSQGSLLYTLSDVTDIIKIAGRYKQNDFQLWVNGTNVVTDLIGNVPVGLNELAFDDGNTTNNSPFYGRCKDLRYYDTALTDAQLTELTT
jgi:hypothetical protein